MGADGRNQIAMTIQIADGDMLVLRGFGTMPLVLKPRTTRNPDGHGDTISPARPTVIGTMAIARFEIRALLFIQNHRRIWHDLQARDLLEDEANACKAIDPPRLVTVRVFKNKQPNAGLPVFMLVDEALGRPILGIHNRLLQRHERHAAGHDPGRASRIVGVSTYFESACEWHPDGYDPPWLASVA